VLLVTAWQDVPVVGQSFVVAVQAPPLALQRQIGRQVRLPLIRLQISPGAQSPADVHVMPSPLVPLDEAHAQSTWSMSPGITQAMLAGQPPRAPAAVRRGSQLNVHV
jgi:hypothetical protein